MATMTKKGAWNTETRRAYDEAHREEKRFYAIAYRERRRREVFAHYGTKCACCGEQTIEFLCIDHTNGGGNAHRRYIGVGSGDAFYGWLVKNSYPPGFRVLCHNCNSARGHYGKCPHEE